MVKLSLICFILVFLLFSTVSPADLNSDAAALLSLRTALKGDDVLPWNSTVSPCTWPYVKCASNRIIELYLSGLSLIGSIPTGTLGNLTALTFVNLQLNFLTGTLPSDLSSCTQLQHLFLQQNQISGDIPAVLFTLPNLTQLVLAGNNLTGEIPVAVSNLTKLTALSLEDNQLTGSIPDLKLANLQQFNVSNNLLDGTIPNKLAGFPSSSFEGNSLCGLPLQNACPGTYGKKRFYRARIAGFFTAGVVDVLAIAFSIILLGPKGKDKIYIDEAGAAAAKSTETNQSASAAAQGTAEASGTDRLKIVFIRQPERPYDLEDLLRASAEVLGKGTYGTTYKATLDMGISFAIKRLRNVTTAMSEQEFRAMMREIGRMDHENLLPLNAYYHSKDESFLIFDYMQVGGLSALLHGARGSGRTPLNWETRLAIALGAARGIAYIHSQSPTSFHGNIKSSNVLLTTSFKARVSDFGLSQLASTEVTHTTGYQAPEVTDLREVSQKADVYSFGVVLLELLTGKKPISDDDVMDLPRFVQSVVREDWTSEVFDIEVFRYEGIEEEMVRFLQLARDCCARNPEIRPPMEEVTSRIELISRTASEKE